MDVNILFVCAAALLTFVMVLVSIYDSKNRSKIKYNEADEFSDIFKDINRRFALLEDSVKDLKIEDQKTKKRTYKKRTKKDEK